MSELIPYFIRLLPGILLAAALLALIPRHASLLRLGVYLMIFLLARDVMTPLGLWRFGGKATFWLRFGDLEALPWLAVATLAILAIMRRLDPDLHRIVSWVRGKKSLALGLGALAAVLIATPIFLLDLYLPLQDRGGTVALSAAPLVLTFALVGNLYEEYLFRGCLQGQLEAIVPPHRAALLSGFAFAFGHTPLAMTVSDIGIPLLAFTLWEGLICAFLRNRCGVLASSLAHGGAIFLLAMGWV